MLLHPSRKALLAQTLLSRPDSCQVRLLTAQSRRVLPSLSTSGPSHFPPALCKPVPSPLLPQPNLLSPGPEYSFPTCSPVWLLPGCLLCTSCPDLLGSHGPPSPTRLLWFQPVTPKPEGRLSPHLTPSLPTLLHEWREALFTLTLVLLLLRN